MHSLEMRVIEILIQQALPIRHHVLQFADSAEASILDGDGAAETKHFGCEMNGKLVGVASLFAESIAELQGQGMRVRAMAVLQSYQRQGIGKLLMEKCIQVAREKNASYIWCTVRPTAEQFYARMGLRSDGAEIRMAHGTFARMVADLHHC